MNNDRQYDTVNNSLWVITRGQRTRYSLALIAMGMASVFTIVAPLVGMYALDVVVYQDFSLGTNVLVSLTRELSGSGLVYVVSMAVGCCRSGPNPPRRGI